MVNGTNAQGSIKRLFDRTKEGKKFCVREVMEKYPQYSYNSIKDGLRLLAHHGWLYKETTKNTQGNITYYWKAGETPELRAFKLFFMLKPTITNRYRHR